jgi:hypothetical protein
MPVYYVLEDVLLPMIPSYAVRVAIDFAICLPGLALCSEAIRGALKPADLRACMGANRKAVRQGTVAHVVVTAESEVRASCRDGAASRPVFAGE